MTLRTIFFSRPWSVDFHLALIDRWRAEGVDVKPHFLAQHLQVAERLRDGGHDVEFLPEEIARGQVPDPRGSLAELERRCGPDLLPLNRYLMAERFFVGRPVDWQFAQLAAYARHFDACFGRFQPQLVVGEGPDTMPTWLGHCLAAHHGAEVAALICSNVPPGRTLILDHRRRIRGAADAFERLRTQGLNDDQRATARSLQAGILGTGTKLDYLQVPRSRAEFARKLANGSVLRAQLRTAIWDVRERVAGNWLADPNPVLLALAESRRPITGWYADRRHLVHSMPERPFVFFPLHFQPEASTLVHGSYFINQLEVIKNLARSLPIGWDLIVKEHFYMRGKRPMHFYRELERIPCVRLVSLALPTNELIMRSEAVAVITGTSGLEASLIGKPVVMFGRFVWDHAPTIHKVAALADLPEVIDAAVNAALGPDDEDVLAFAAAWDEVLPRARYYTTRAYDRNQAENVAVIADELLALSSVRTAST